MTEGVRLWLLSVLSVSLLCALADALMPKGPVKGVGKLVCGLVLTAAVAAPIAQVELERGNQWLEEYRSGTQYREEELKNQVEEEMKRIIEREFEAYIVDKAAQLGVVCTVRVECRWEQEGVYLPGHVWIEGAATETLQEQLTQTLCQELGLTWEEITFDSGEGAA